MSSITIPRDEYCALLIGQTQCPCLDSWMAQSASFMDSLLLDMEVLVIGDLNSDALPGSSCPEGQALMDISLYTAISRKRVVGKKRALDNPER